MLNTTSLIHPFTPILTFLCFSEISAVYLTFMLIHTPREASESNLGLISCPKMFGTQTGGASL